VGYQAIDPYLLSAYKKTLDKYVEKRTRAALREYQRNAVRRYRYRGTTFYTANARDTDGWFAAWERQVKKNRRNRLKSR